MFGMPDKREGFSMRVNGLHLNRPDLHLIAAELSIGERDVLFKDGILTVYHTSKASQEIVEDGALTVFIAMAIDSSPEILTEITPVKADPSQW